MNDRELLELAAKAAGYWLRSERDADFQSDKVWISTQSLDGVRYWPEWKVFDPLTDDGDALRLAVKLCIDVVFSTEIHPMHAHRQVTAWYGEEAKRVDEFMRDDLAAVRRAIVRAAAEIGKAMQ